MGILKKLDRAYDLLVDAEAALHDAGCNERDTDAVYAGRETVRNRMRQIIMSPAFVDDPLKRFNALEVASGIDGVVSDLMVNAARAFADSCERVLARQAAEG